VIRFEYWQPSPTARVDTGDSSRRVRLYELVLLFSSEIDLALGDAGNVATDGVVN
jgi:hypothetical protein